MRQALLVTVLFTLFANASFAQARVKRYTAPLSATVDISKLEDKYSATISYTEMPEPDAADEQEKLHDIKEQSAKLFPRITRHVAYKKTSAPLPVVEYSYKADSLSGIPPDNDMAINNDDTFVTVMNQYFTTYTAVDGKTIGFHKSLASLSSAVGLNGPNDFRYDPKIMYDQDADRFIAVMLNGTDSFNYIVVGFSDSHNPRGTWHFYKFLGDYANDTTWFDFPSVAITKNEFFFTGNKVHYGTPWQTGFKESVIYQLRKADGYAGSTSLNYQIWDSVTWQGKPVRCIYPVKGGAGIKGPDEYFLSNRDFDVQNDTVFLIHIPDTIGSTANTLTVKALVCPIKYGVPPNGRQPDTVVLATNDGRVLGAYIEGNEIQFVSTSVDAVNGAAGIFHGIISDYSAATPTIQARLFSIDSLDLAYPNISYTGNAGGNNQSIISFDFSGLNTYPGFGAIYFDGSQFSDLLRIKNGDSAINISGIGHEQRWGDYSGSQPDWDSVGKVWVNGLYGRQFKSYGNYVAKLVAPGYTAVPLVPAARQMSSVLYPNPAEQFIQLSFEMDRDQPVDFVIYDIQGRMVDKLLHAYCHDGKNVVTFNTASLTPGMYYLRAVSEQGKVIAVHSFVRQ
ncbi:MAG: T9SS type A sorting domain-containing protein [Flavipsychrobacter sp.]